MSASPPHPSPAAMAREAWPGLPGDDWDDLRGAYESGAAAYRAHVIAWLRAEHGAAGRLLAADLEGTP